MNDESGPRWLILLCFACIYLFWGATFIALKFAITQIPPMILSGTRYLLAGLVLLGIGRLRREAPPEARLLRLAALSGFLLVFANGLVSVSIQWFSSATAAVLVGSVPVWIILLNWWAFERVRPTGRQAAGIALSLLGIFLLTRSQAALSHAGKGAESGLWVASLAIFVAIISWSLGTLVQRSAGKLRSVFSVSGIQLATGGMIVTFLGLLRNPGFVPDPSKMTWQVGTAFLYLVLFGSVISFTAYLWLSARVTPAQVSTYAVVNPLVAVWLGWWIADEQINAAMIGCSILVLGGLCLVVFEPRSVPVVETQ